MALAAALPAGGAVGQTLTFNIPYRCPDGMTYVVQRCEIRGRLEICYYEEWKNGQLLGHANSTRGQLNNRLQSCSVSQAGQPAAAPSAASRQRTERPAHAGQAGRGNPVPDPPYLGQFPSVERVMTELKGADPMETAARQMGAFWQLQQILQDLSGVRANRNELSPGEEQLIGAYRGGYQTAEQSYASPPDKAKWYKMHVFYEVDHGFREELFKRFLSPALLAEYTKTRTEREATVQANQRAREQAVKEERERAEAASQASMKQQQQPEWQRRLARCVAAGRSETQCFTEEAGRGFGKMFPILSNTPPPPGLALTGAYALPGGFSIWFYPETAIVGCNGIKAEAGYAVGTKENQLHVRLLPSKTAGLLKLNEDLMKLVPQSSKPDEWQGQRVVFSLRADGKLVGSGPINVTGQVQVGERKQQTTEEKRLSEFEARSTLGAQKDASGWYVEERTTKSVPVSEPRTARCMLGTLSPTGPSPVAGSPSTLAAAALNLGSGGNDAAAGKMPPPGLRVNGQYAGQAGFDIEFFPESALLTCRQAVVAREYSVSVNANHPVVNIQNGGTPLVVELRPDGTLAGSGPVRVNGRVLVGQKERVENALVVREPVFQPVTDTCSLGVLTPAAARPAQ